MRFFQAIEMDVEEESAGRAELVQRLLDEHAIGAEVNVLATLEDATHQGADLGIDHRFASADADDGSTGLIDRLQALVDASVCP